MAKKTLPLKDSHAETLSVRQLITQLLSTNLDDLVFLRSDDNNSANGLTSVQFFTMDVAPKIDLKQPPLFVDEDWEKNQANKDLIYEEKSIVLLG